MHQVNVLFMREDYCPAAWRTLVAATGLLSPVGICLPMQHAEQLQLTVKAASADIMAESDTAKSVYASALVSANAGECLGYAKGCTSSSRSFHSTNSGSCLHETPGLYGF